MSVQVSRLFSFIALCLLSALLLTFCGDEDNATQTDNSGTAQPNPTPTPSATSTPTGTQNGANKPRHRFTPAKITAGLPFSFELALKGDSEGKPYLLSLDSCGDDTLLVSGQWPQDEHATTYIKGTGENELNNLAIINTNGSPTIDASCQLKVTVGQGTADEKSTTIALDVNPGKITLSNASIVGDKIKLDVTGVDSDKSFAILVARKGAVMHEGKEYQQYRPAAMSTLSIKVKGDGTNQEVEMYEVPTTFPPIPSTKITSLPAGDYLVSAVNYQFPYTIFNATAIKVTVE